MNIHGPQSLPPPPSGVPQRRTSVAAWLGWLSLLLVAGGAVAFYVLFHRPLAKERDALKAASGEQSAQTATLGKDVAELRAARAKLEQQNAELEEKLATAIQEKKAAIAELEKARGELSSQLETEIEAGDVRIERREGRLVVGVADEILFATGEAEVSKKGEKLLGHIAGTLSQVKGHVIQVGGHTDDAPIVSPEVRERFPTNWELSAARATNVVRFLESTGIPGRRLVAAGFAQFRPAALGTSKAARKQNRRIEIVLLPKP